MVRFAEEKDLARVNELRKQVNDVHVNGRPDIFKPGFCRELQDFVYKLHEDEDKNIIVVERDGIICGMVCVSYVIRPEGPYMLERKYVHIEEIAVDQAFKRQGVATELFEFIKQDARERGFTRIELDVWEFNDSAKEFYEAVGFRLYRRFLEMDCGDLIN